MNKSTILAVVMFELYCAVDDDDISGYLALVSRCYVSYISCAS